MLVFLFRFLYLGLFLGSSYAMLDGLQDGQLSELALEIQQLKGKVAVLESQLNGTAQSQGPVAFTAGLSKTLTTVGSHQHIVFDNVITNIGNGYKPFSGHFIAPVRGAYAFFVAVTNIPQHSSSVQLKRNGQWIGHVLAHGSSNNPGLYVTSTLAVTVQLETGDEVWVQNEYAFSSVEEIDGGNWSYFSGHLIATN